MHLDFETYCDLNLLIVGLHRYMEHPSFELLCYAYDLNKDGNIKTVGWKEEDPKEFIDALKDDSVIIKAYNAQFERKVILYHFGLDLPPSRFICSQALACTNSYPAKLEDVGNILLPQDKQKLKRGRELINLFCKPRKPTKADSRTRIYPTDEPKQFLEFIDYCRQDVVAESAIVDLLPRPHLQSKEQEIWEHTVIQNDRGLPIDIEMVDQVVDVLEEWKEKVTKKLCKYTNNEITTGGQIQRIKVWCERYNYPMPIFDQEHMAKALKDPKLPNEVKKIIKFRQALGKTSTAKFVKLQEMLCEDQTVKGNLFYYGTITGRYGGRGFQMQNLPRAKTKDPLALRKAFMERKVEGNVAEHASKLIRPSIFAPEGFMVCAADYSSLENRGLHWVAGDEDTLEEFRQGKDQYITFAAARYGRPYEEILEGYLSGDEFYDTLRFRGKVAVLGLGYKMWIDTYIATADGWGLKLTREEAESDIYFYRNKYPLVKRLWYKLYKAARICVETNQPTKYNNIRFRIIQGRLYMILPSGRPIVYNSPLVEEVPYFGKTKLAITFMGKNPYSSKWQRLQITEGRLTENAIQGLGREVQTHGALEAEYIGYPIVGSVHDENIAIIPEGFGSVEEFCKLNCKMGDWAKGLPLKATGYIEKRYKKD